MVRKPNRRIFSDIQVADVTKIETFKVGLYLVSKGEEVEKGKEEERGS